MREIKFRAWDERREVMHNEFNFIQYGEGQNWIIPIKHIGTEDWLNDLNDKIRSATPHCRQQFKIMQYTGLKDRNGVEIYEGDVLEYFSGLVAKGFNPMIKQIVMWEEYKYIGINNWPKSSVIGNIYSNPELLKKVDE